MSLQASRLGHRGDSQPGPLATLLSPLSTPPFRWLIAGPMRTVPKGRRGCTATVTVGPVFQCLPWVGAPGAGLGPWVALEGRPSGVSASLLSISHPLTPPPAPTAAAALWKFEGLEFVLCFQGIKTGQCVEFNGTHRTCEIQGWCPVESGTVPV